MLQWGFLFFVLLLIKDYIKDKSEPLKKKGAWTVDYPGPDIPRNIFHSLDVCWILNPCEDIELDENHPIVWTFFRRCCYEICGSWSLLNTKLPCQALEQVTISVPCLESLSFGHRKDGCFIVFFFTSCSWTLKERDKGQTSDYMENKCKCIVGRFHSHCCQSVLS